MIKLKLYNLFLTTLVFSLLFLAIFNINIYAQSSDTGTLSFNPENVTVNEGETAEIGIVYTGVEIKAAKIVVNVGSDLQITALEEGEDLQVILKEVESGEIHIGKLSGGDITSGTTLATMTVQAIGCGDGSISFDSNEILVPEVNMSFNDATYTVNCGNTPDTPAPTSTSELEPINNPTSTDVTEDTSPSTLPKTGILDNNNFYKIFISTLITTLGISLAILVKNSKRKNFSNSINLINYNKN